MEMDTLIKKSTSATPEEIQENWATAFLPTYRKFGSLGTSAWAGALCDCCGNIHLNNGKFKYTDRVYGEELTGSFADAARRGKELAKDRERPVDRELFFIESTVGIYSGEFMDAKSLKETVGLNPDSPGIEFVDDDGTVHSIVWKDE